MAYDGWVEFNGQELVNLSRTVQLADALGINTVWTRSEDVSWIESDLGGTDYEDITDAPWYDPAHPASGEFAGFVSLGMPGLDDSTLESTPVEYVTDGGNSGKARHATLPIVVSMAIIASTDRGADYGKRYLDQLLSARTTGTFCSGATLRYFQYGDMGAPTMHRRDVKMTRGTSVTRKQRADCAVTWLVTFTLTCADPFEYSEATPALDNLGDPGGPTGLPAPDWGIVALTQTPCPVFDYTPIYDPLYPALVPPPSVPDFYPAGWNMTDGEGFTRYWAFIPAPEPSHLNVVPFITLNSVADARGVRVSIWPADSSVDDQCGPLFSAAITYLPAGSPFVIDGEQQASYVEGGASPVVRRTDSLVYSPDAKPVQWSAFNDFTKFLVTLDLFDTSSGVLADVAFIQKSD